LPQQIHKDILNEFKYLHTMSILNNKFSITITDSWKTTVDKMKFASNSHILVDLYLTQGYVLQIFKVNKTVTVS